jgi:hypothetical protein
MLEENHNTPSQPESVDAWCRARCGSQLVELLLSCITHRLDIDMKGDYLASKRVIAIYSKKATLNLRNNKGTALSPLVLHLHLCPDLTKLLWNIGNGIGKGKSWIMWSEPILRLEGNANRITGRLAEKRLFDLLKQTATMAVDIVDRQRGGLDHLITLIQNSIGNLYPAALLDCIRHTLPLPNRI